MGRPAYQGIEGEFYVISCNRLAIGKARRRIDVKCDRETVIRQVEVFGYETVHAERLVQAFLEQALEDQGAQPLRCYALEQVRIQAVE